MGKRFLFIMLLIVSLVLPCAVVADAEKTDVVIVVMADYNIDGNMDQDSLISTLQAFTAVAEMQGRNVAIYGPSRSNKDHILYRIDNKNPNWDKDFPKNYKQIPNYTISFLQKQEDAEAFANKHLFLLIGNLDPEVEISDKFAGGIPVAKQVDVIRLTESALPESKKWTTPFLKGLTSTQPEGTLNTDIAATDRQALTTLLLSSLCEDGQLHTYAKQDDAGTAYIIPAQEQIQETAFLHITVAGGWPESGLEITGADGTVRTLTCTPAEGAATEDEGAEGEVAAVEFTVGRQLNDGAVFALKDIPVQEWTLPVSESITGVTVYYSEFEHTPPTESELGEPYLLLKATAKRSGESQVLMKQILSENFFAPDPGKYDGDSWFKGETVVLALNTEQIDIKQRTRLADDDVIQLEVTSNDGVITKDGDTYLFTATHAGQYDVTVRLLDAEVDWPEQTYMFNVVNRVPAATESTIPAELQGKYWDSNQTVEVPLADMFTDPDGDEFVNWHLVWNDENGETQGQSRTMGPYTLFVHQKAQTLRITRFAEKLSNEAPAPITFTVRAVDEAGAYADKELTLNWRSLEYDFSQMTMNFPNNDFPTELSKHNKVEFAFGFQLDGQALNETMLSYLTQDGVVSLVAADNGETPVLGVEWDAETGVFHGSIEVSKDGDYAFTVKVQIGELGYDKSFVCHDGTLKVVNAKPAATIAINEAVGYGIPPATWQESYEIAGADAFADGDGDKLTYKLAVRRKINSEWYNVANAPETIDLPFTFSTTDYKENAPGLFEVEEWQVVISAYDGEESDGNSSAAITRTYRVWHPVTLIWHIVLAAVILISIVTLVIRLRKPVFARNAVLELSIAGEAIRMPIGGWKKSPMPLNRIIPLLQVMLFDRETCARMAKVYVKPLHNGLELVDKNREPFVQGSCKVHKDKEADCQIGTYNVTLKLTAGENL